MDRLYWYRFKTRAVEDYRPLVDMQTINMPWWCTGQAGDGSFVIIVCYLPKGADLKTYWDDAYEIERREVSGIEYSGRFPKPEYLA